MDIEKAKTVVKVVAVTQAIIAPSLILVGHFTNNKIVKHIGIWWCALMALDSARIACLHADTLDELRLKDLVNDAPIIQKVE